MTLHEASGPFLLQQAISDWTTLPVIADCSSKFKNHILLVTAALKPLWMKLIHWNDLAYLEVSLHNMKYYHVATNVGRTMMQPRLLPQLT